MLTDSLWLTTFFVVMDSSPPAKPHLRPTPPELEPAPSVFSSVAISQELPVLGETFALPARLAKPEKTAREWILPGISAVALAVWLPLDLAGFSQLAGFLLVVCYATAGWVAVQSAWQTIRQLKLDVDVLMLLAAGVSAGMGEAPEGGLLLVLFAASRAMENFTQRRANSALYGLQSLWPQQATLITPDGPQLVALSLVKPQDRVLVRPGDRVPVDGVVLNGASAVDESALTGESVPKEVATGDQVHAGTLNLYGRLTVRCSVPAGKSTLARVIELVEKALTDRPTAQRLLDTIGPWLAWMVLSFSGLVMLFGGMFNWFGTGWSEAIYRGLTLMIVGSPCALIISTPVAYLAALSAAARMGVLVKGGRYLEALSGVQAVVFDKTGTLTTGEIRLLNVEKVGGNGQLIPACEACTIRALSLAAGLEQSSSHPLARALVNAAEQQKIEPARFEDVTEIAGSGLIGKTLCGETLRIGRRAFVTEAMGESQVGVWLKAGPEVYRFTFVDKLREEAQDVIHKLRKIGIKYQEMLTGDSEPAAQAIASEAKLDGFRCNLLPEQKIERAEELARQIGPVAMVGDGVNDAAALAKVRCGIAIGRSASGKAGGSDITIDAAPVVLLNNNLTALPRLFRQAHKTRRIVAENLTLACAVIVIMSALTLIGHVPIWTAVLCHEGSTVLVALNALRLLRE